MTSPLLSIEAAAREAKPPLSLKLKAGRSLSKGRKKVTMDTFAAVAVTISVPELAVTAVAAAEVFRHHRSRCGDSSELLPLLRLHVFPLLSSGSGYCVSRLELRLLLWIVDKAEVTAATVTGREKKGF
ncbi:uncharacterized protein DS421_5g144330 [Arachis hypogaea]|nr:uncharacterized protein DS421_5g144330 [Arachis hypogaea]